MSAMVSLEEPVVEVGSCVVVDRKPTPLENDTYPPPGSTSARSPAAVMMLNLRAVAGTTPEVASYRARFCSFVDPWAKYTP